MRATDDRYRAEHARFDLAIRMIGHEARTGTIRFWTGLNDDRIRKLYVSYFKYGDQPVRRRRGRSPTQIAPLVSTPARALESGAFAFTLYANELLVESGPQPQLKNNLHLGHRFCECFESYRSLIPRPTLTFELGWNLLLCVRRGDELGFRRCDGCGVCYIVDLLALPAAGCPGCYVRGEAGAIQPSAQTECVLSESPTARRAATH